MAEKNTHGEYNRRLIRDAFQTKDAANNAKKPTGIRSKAMDVDARRELQTAMVEGSKAIKRKINAQRKVDNLQNEREQLIVKRDKANASTAAAAEKRIGKQSAITPSRQSTKKELVSSTPKRTTQTTISREKVGNGPTGNIVKREEPKYNQAREDAQRRAREAAMAARRGR